MRKPSLLRRVRGEIRAGLRLIPVLLVALLLAAFVWRTDTAADPSSSRVISGLFQSSPVGAPTWTPTATPLPAMPTALPSATEVLPEPPSLVTGTPGLIPTATSTIELIVTLTPTLPLAPTETPVPTMTPAASGEEPTPGEYPGTPGESLDPAVEASALPDDRQRYAEGESDVKFEWSMLFDSTSLFLSYAWLCCGIFAFLAIPVVFVVLWVASKRRQQQQ